MPIISTSLIINNAGPKDNPRELEYFEHNTKYTPPPNFCSHVAWTIYGDVPKGISIDSGTGKIFGNIKAFYDQPSTQNNYPYEEILYDGSNWQNNGRYKNSYYDFHFTIQRDTLVSGPNPSTGALDCSVQIPYKELSNVYIKEIKCHNIDNKIFIKQYLESTQVSPETNERTSINVNGIVYTNYNDLKNNHPGPFNCP